MPCKWHWKLDTNWTLYDNKIVVNQLRHLRKNYAIIAALCSKNKRFSESVAKWFHDSGSSMYILLDDLPSQTGVSLNNGRQWKIAQKQVSLLVLLYKGIISEYRNHWEALTGAKASMSQCPLSIGDFHVSFCIVYVDYDVLLCECKLSESIAVAKSMEGMVLVHWNVHSHNTSVGHGSIRKQPFLFGI